MRQLLMLVALGAMTVAGCESAVLVNNRPEREPNWESTPTSAEPETASANVNSDQAGRAEAASTTQPASAEPAASDQRIETQDVTIESQSN